MIKLMKWILWNSYIIEYNNSITYKSAKLNKKSDSQNKMWKWDKNKPYFTPKLNIYAKVKPRICRAWIDSKPSGRLILRAFRVFAWYFFDTSVFSLLSVIVRFGVCTRWVQFFIQLFICYPFRVCFVEFFDCIIIWKNLWFLVVSGSLFDWPILNISSFGRKWWY